jgi:hypothetical protein
MFWFPSIIIFLCNIIEVAAMAKGLRSKSMRKNRSYLRKTRIEPLIQKRQEELAAKLRENLEKSKPNSLLKVKEVMNKTQRDIVEGENDDNDEEEMQEEDDDDEEETKVTTKSKQNHQQQITKVIKGGRTIESVTKSGNKR